MKGNLIAIMPNETCEFAASIKICGQKFTAWTGMQRTIDIRLGLAGAICQF